MIRTNIIGEFLNQIIKIIFVIFTKKSFQITHFKIWVQFLNLTYINILKIAVILKQFL